MKDEDSHGSTTTPEINDGDHDPSLFILVRALAKETKPHRIILGVGGLLISGKVVDENTWLKLQREQNPALEDVISKTLQASRSPLTSNARLTYLRERLRWGTGLTEAQMEELETVEQAEAQKSQFLHLAEVNIYGPDEAIRLHTWRARLDRVDGYSLATELGKET
jgi:hypothetical protein